MGWPCGRAFQFFSAGHCSSISPTHQACSIKRQASTICQIVTLLVVVIRFSNLAFYCLFCEIRNLAFCLVSRWQGIPFEHHCPVEGLKNIPANFLSCLLIDHCSTPIFLGISLACLLLLTSNLSTALWQKSPQSFSKYCWFQMFRNPDSVVPTFPVNKLFLNLGPNYWHYNNITVFYILYEIYCHIVHITV